MGVNLGSFYMVTAEAKQEQPSEEPLAVGERYIFTWQSKPIVIDRDSP